MVTRAFTVTFGAVAAAFGFASAYFVPRSLPAQRVVTRLVSAPAPSSRACPVGSPAPAPAPAPCKPASTQPALRPPSIEPRTSPVDRRASPLKAFRFVGIGPAGGLRLGRVAPGSLPEALGLRTGDELISVNDFKLGDPEQALTAYARLRTAERLQLAVSRAGSRAELVYFIR
ncbi:MAG: hypothetical protein EOO73_25525 [Myxococcales bacterium]|nr:MAG: hypothetical protein EOO73_25525 [Myxococcales bacterium]